MENAIEVYNITKKIKNKIILNNIGFKIKKNTIYGIVGPNGSGKTTLLRILTGLYKTSIGFFKINDIIYKNNNEIIYKDLSALIESPKFYDNLSGKENLELLNIMYKNKYDIEEVLNRLNIDFYNKKVKNYSLGMKQKLSIAMCLMSNPKILVLDEPTNGFDPVEMIKFKNLINNLKDITIIICSHDLNLISSLCDEILFLKSGRIVDIKHSPFGENLEKIFEVI